MKTIKRLPLALLLLLLLLAPASWAANDNIVNPASSPVRVRIYPDPSASATPQTVTDTNIGAKADTAATTDTGTFSLISLFKRALQKWTSIDSKTPSPGQTTMAGSSPVTIASDQPAIPVSGTLGVTAAPAYTTAETALHTAATANANGAALDVTGLTTVAFQTSTPWGAVLVPEATLDGTTWNTVPAFRSSAGSNFSMESVTSITSGNAGFIFRSPVSGMKQFRVRISSYASGSITVKAVGIADGANVGGSTVTATTSSLPDGLANSAWAYPFVGSSSGNAPGYATATYIYNGATWDKQRASVTFKPFTISASSAETTIWTPGASKKFRVIGYNLYSDTATTLTFRDNTAGTVILRDGVGTAARANSGPMGNGILSAVANNVLTLQCGTAATVNGTVFGTEE